MQTSYSALETFLQCPQKYKFQEIDRIRTPKGKDAIFGTTIHSALKFYHQPGRLAPASASEAIKYFEDNWNKDLFADPYAEQAFFLQGKSILERYCKENDAAKFSPLAMELYFQAPIGKDHILSGKIDRIDKLEDGSFEIIDYKTSRRLPSQEDVNNDLQLAIYQIGFLNKWPQFSQPIKVSLYFLQHGIKLSNQLSEEDVAKTKEKALGIIAQIEKAAAKNKFDPNPGILCDWCGHQKYCPMFSHKFKDINQSSQEDIDIQKVLSEYFQLKETEQEIYSRISELKEKINRYCDAEKVERVFTDDQSMSIVRSSQQRFNYDWDVVSNVLKSAGKWEEVFAPDDKKLKKVMSALSEEDFRKIEETRKVESEWKVLRVERNGDIKKSPPFEKGGQGGCEGQ